MLEIGGGRDLLHEALSPEHRGEFGSQHFYRHLAVMFEVFGEVDGGQAAGAEFVLDGVTVGEGGLEAIEVSHVDCRLQIAD